jgi:hypothetical protein
LAQQLGFSVLKPSVFQATRSPLLGKSPNPKMVGWLPDPLGLGFLVLVTLLSLKMTPGESLDVSGR